MTSLTRRFVSQASLAAALALFSSAAGAQETLNVYSIWPENWARPMFAGVREGDAASRSTSCASPRARRSRASSPRRTTRASTCCSAARSRPSPPASRRACSSPTSRRRLRQAAGALQAGRRPVDRDRRRSAGVHDQREVPRRATTCKRAGVVGRPAQPGLQEHAADGRRAHLGHGGDAHLLGARGERARRGEGVRVHEEAAAERAALHQERRRRHAAGRASARPAAASSSSSMRSTPRPRATTS